MQKIHSLNIGSILGLGIDSVEIERCIPWLAMADAQICRIFSPHELAYSREIPIKTLERLAVRFAAKEAFYKAFTMANPDHGIPFLTICKKVAVRHAPTGQPLLEVDASLGEFTPIVSLTHTKTTATAIILLIKSSPTTRSFI